MRFRGLLLAVVGLIATSTLSGCGQLSGQGADSVTGDTVRYVALGDSYSAAPAVPSPKGDDGCLRSTNNYPSLVAEELDPEEFIDVTCSGADTEDMGSAQYPKVKPQLDAVTADTDVVTLGLGGNDFNVFFTLVTQCQFARLQDPTGAPCQKAMNTTGQDTLLTNIDSTRERLAAVVEKIQEAAPDARVLLVGYPQILPAEGTCPELLPLADGDYSYGRSINKALTDMLADVAKSTRSEYVDMWTVTAGHDICAADPWINGRINDPKRAASFHPFAAEQEAAATEVLAVLDD